jgi:formiminoglutamase
MSDTRTAFAPPPTSLFLSKKDPNDLRLGDLVKPLAAQSLSSYEHALSLHTKACAVLAGYPDDEGIRINGGRPGAAQAPDTVRRSFFKMTPSLFASQVFEPFLDLGNLQIQDLSLEQRHTTARQFAKSTFEKGLLWLSVGGGHDYGFADAAAFVDFHQNQSPAQKQKPLILNFDAHLDVRPTTHGLSSGTPFYRLLEMGAVFDFAEIGIQGQCTSKAHYDWALSRGAKIISMEEINATGLGFVQTCLDFLAPWIERRRSAFISIDIDGFSSAFAMGCSQSWATGFQASEFFLLLQILLKRLDVKGVGIYEVSPPLDQDDRTSKLAAQILHRCLYQI